MGYIVMGSLVYQKPALSFEDQLKQLDARGLYVSDKKEALKTLRHISYYRLSAYWYPFRRHTATGEILDDFKQNSSFVDVVYLYEFDKHLRLLVFDAVESVEVFLRTTITYVLGTTFGSHALENKNNFAVGFDHQELIKKIHSSLSVSNETFIEHFKNKYSGFPVAVPVWMTTETLSFGTLSKIFSGLKTTQQQEIANQFGINNTVLKNWLHFLTLVRNICAHHGRLWNREFGIQPKIPKKTSEWGWARNFQNKKHRSYTAIYMLLFLLNTTECLPEWRKNICDFIKNQPSWIQQAMGCPNDWKTHPLW